MTTARDQNSDDPRFDRHDESDEGATRSFFNWQGWQAADGPDGPLGRDDLEELKDDDPDRIGKYKLIARVPGGSAATVKYLALDSLARRYLLKVLWSDGRNDNEDIKHLLLQEVRLARRIRSNRVARVYGYYEECDHAYVVQRFISGPTLRHVLDRNGRLTGVDLLHTARGTLQGQRDIHRGGAVHGDPSPDNTIITPRGPVIIDLGGGRVDGEQRRYKYGTEGYLSLEHLQKDKDVLAASDLQSWAHMIAEAGTGHRPFDPAGTLTAAQYRQVVLDGTVSPDLTGLPDALAAIIRPILVETDPAKRPSEDWVEQQLTALIDAASPTGTRQMSLLYPALDDGKARVVPTATELLSYDFWQQLLQGWRHEAQIRLGTRWPAFGLGAITAWVAGVVTALVLHLIFWVWL